MYFRMILFSYICIVSILEFVVAVQADTKQTLNNNELSLSLSNEQVTEYNYERTIQSAATENNQDHSITTNINTEFVQKIHSSNELDLDITDSTDLNSALNVDIMSEMNKLNNNEASITNDYGTQSNLEITNTKMQIETDTDFKSPYGEKDSLDYNIPTNPNGVLTDKQNGQDYDSNGNKISDSSFMNSYQSSSYYGYNLQNTADQNGEIPTTATSSPGSNGSPSSAIPTSPNSNVNSATKSNQNAGSPSTTKSTPNSNGSPSSSSPTPPNGDSTGKPNGQDYDSNGNKISDSSFMNSYQSSSYYGYNLQNTADQNGEIPTPAASTPGSNGSPSSAIPTSPNSNVNGATKSNQNAGSPSTTKSMPNSNGSPSSSSPTPPNGDSTGKPNGQDYDSNGNKISDTGSMNSYQSSSYYGYNVQNIEIPTTATSTPGLNGLPSILIPTYPTGNLNSAPNSNQNSATPSTATSTSNSNGSPTSSSPTPPNGDSTGNPNGQDYDSNGNKISDSSFMNSYQSSSYYGYNLQNTADRNGEIPTTATSSPGSNGSPSSAIPTSPNSNVNSATKSNQNAGSPSTTKSMPNSNGSPSSSSPTPPNGDSTGKPNGQDYDSNGNKISDTGSMNGYQSSSYYGYNVQNIEIPTTATSTPGLNGLPSILIPTYPTGNLNSAPNSNQNSATPSTATSTSNSNGSPTSSSPTPPNGDSTGNPNGQDYDSNGNKISDSSFMNSYQSSSYYGYNLQNTADRNGEIPTTATSSPGSNGSPSSAIPTSPNSNVNSATKSNQNAGSPSTTKSTPNSNGSPSSSSPTPPNGDSTGKPNGQDYDSNGNKISDTGSMNGYQSSSYYGYNVQNIEIPTTATSTPGLNGLPSILIPTYPTGNLNSAPNSYQNSATTSTATSTSNSNGSPTSSSPTPPNGDSTGKPNGQDYDSNGNKISDSSFMNSYQSSSYYGYNLQSTADQNGEIPTTATSSPGSNGSPSSAIPTSPNSNVNSATKSNQNAGSPSTTKSTPNSNGSPSSSSPTPPNGDSTGKPNGQDYDSNGNKISDSSFMNSYQSSSYYGYNLQNTADQNGEIPTPAASTPGSNGSPSSAIPTSPNSNVNGATKSNQNAGSPSTTKSMPNSNGSPSSSSPTPPNGDSTGKTNGQDYDSNGKKISDTGSMNSYQSSSYYGYNLQNTANQNGEIPTPAASTPGSNGSPSSAIPTSPNSNVNGATKSNQNAGSPSTTKSMPNSNGSPSSSSPTPPNGDSTGKTNGQDYDSNGNKISDTGSMNSYQSSSYYGYNMQNIEIPTTATSSPGLNGLPSILIPTYPTENLNTAPNSNQNSATPSTATSTSNSNGSPTSSSPTPPNGDSTGKPNGQDYDSNGNKISDSSFMNNYQSPSYYGYIMQNIIDQNGEIPTTATSSPGSNGSPSSAIPTSPNSNVNSAPKSNQNAPTPSTTKSTPNANGSPSSSSPTPSNGDSTGKPNGQDYDSNGNKISDTGSMNSYQSSSYYGYNLQNTANQNGEIPTPASSTPGSNGSPSSAIPTSPNSNVNGATKSNQNAGSPSTTKSMPNSNGSPSSSSPTPPNGDSTGKTNGQDYDSNGNKISDTGSMNSYQSSSYYGYNVQNIEIPTTATSSPGLNSLPSILIPTYPTGNLNSAPNSNQNSATPSTATSTSNSNGSPTSSSPTPPNGDSTGKPNGQDYDSNGNKISDTSFMNNYQSPSYYGYIMQNIIDQNGEIPTTATSSPGPNGSPSSSIPTSPNSNINSAPNSNQNAPTPSTAKSTPNANGSPSSSSPTPSNGDSTGKPNGQDYDSNGNKISDTSFMNTYQSSSYYGYNLQNTADQNGEIPTTATSSPGSNGSPSISTPTYPSGNLNIAPNSNQNAATPSTARSTPNSYGSPSSSSPTPPNGDSTGKLNGQDYDSYGNKISDTGSMNSYQSSNYYGYIQNTADQDTSYNYPQEMSEYLNNQILQNSASTFNLQNSATPDQFGIIPSSSLTIPNENSKDSPSGGGTGLNTPSDMNGLPLTVDQAQTGTEYSSLGSETYGSSSYDIDYELRNMDEVEVLSDGQLNMDDRYISDNYVDVNNGRVNIPLLNENGDVYNNYFYADNSINTIRSLDGNFDTPNEDNYVDGFFENVPFDNGNMQEPSYEPYAPNLNARYENNQPQYGLNQNSPPFRGYPIMGNDIAPFDTNIYPDMSAQMGVMNSDLYKYNNIDGIVYDQTKIGIDETSPENNQFSKSDLNTFSSNQISQTTDSFIDTDLTSDHLVYDFIDSDNTDLETIDSNYIGQVNENNGQGFIGYNNMQSINVPENNQFNGEYTTKYLSNSGTFETSFSNTGTDATIDAPEGPYLTPQLLDSRYNLLTSSDLNKQSSDLNSMLIDNVQLNGYLYSKTDTTNFNTQVEGAAADNANGSPMNSVDNRFKSIQQSTVFKKNDELDVGQNVYGANGQVIGIIYKPSDIVKTKNRHKYSGSSSFSSPNDSEFSDDMHAIGHDIKRAARDAIGKVGDNIKDAYDTTKAVGKAVGNIAENAASKAADGIEQTAKTAYQGSKDVAKDVGNAVGEAANDVGETAKNAYQGSKDVAKDVGNAVDEAANDVGKTAKNAYQGSKDVAKDVGSAVGEAANNVGETAKNAYQGSKDAVNSIENAISAAADDGEETA